MPTKQKRRRKPKWTFEPRPDVIYMTEEGKQKLEDELRRLLSQERQQVLAEIRESRRMGEFIEDSDYDDAKKEQALIEGRIQELQEILRLVEVVPKDYIPTDKVGFGSIVELEDMQSRKRMSYQIVGPFEADPIAGRISYESPLGEQLVGCKVGDVVKVRAPVGMREYKVVNIRK